MSKTRKAIVEFAKAHVYWYVHQSDGKACKKANMLEKQAYRLVDYFGGPEDAAALHAAQWRTIYLIPSQGGE